MGGGISYRISNDPGIESAIPDFIIRSESAKNDLFSKFRLHCLYAIRAVAAHLIFRVKKIEVRGGVKIENREYFI